MTDLKQLFRASGKRQRDIAEAVGRSEGAVSQWVSGERYIPADLVLRVEEVTGIPRHRLRPDLWETRMLNADPAQTAPDLTHLQRLEAESIHIMREVAAEAERPVMLYSVGKDSAVMLHLAMKSFAPGKPPFPLLHVNTTWKFGGMIAFRDQRVAELGLTMHEWINKDGVARGINPFDHGGAYTAARGATRRRAAARSASSRSVRRSTGGTRRSSGPSFGICITRARRRARAYGCFRCPTGRSWTSGNTSIWRTSRSCRCISRLSGRWCNITA